MLAVALVLSAIALVADVTCPAPALGQVFLGSKPNTPLAVGPLMVRGHVTPALGSVTVDVLFSVVVPPDRSPAELEQDLYILWPGAVRGGEGARHPALAKFVEARGFDVVDEGTLPLFAQNLYRMHGDVPEERLSGGAPYVTFVHHLPGLGLSSPATWIRVPWTPRLVNRAWIIDLRFVADSVLKPKAASWLERVFTGPRHRIMLAFNDVRGRAVFPLYVEHRDRVLRLSDDPAQIVINFSDSGRLKIDELSPSIASRRVSETLESTEAVSLFLERSEGVTPQALTVQFGYFTGLQMWAPVVIPILFFVAGNVAGVVVRGAAERISRRLAGRLSFGRAREGPTRETGVIIPREVLGQIAPGVTTDEDLRRLLGVSPEEHERLDGSGRRTLVYRGRRFVPRLRRRFGWFATLSHWDAEDHDVEIVIERGVVRDVQARIRRARVQSPDAPLR